MMKVSGQVLGKRLKHNKMKQPIFETGDTVKFKMQNKTYQGTVYIVDRFGTFEQNEEPSYDIMAENVEMSDGSIAPECLIKHIRESELWID